MKQSPEQLSQELGRLRRTFLERLPERARAIETMLNEASSGAEVDRGRLDELFHLAHRLCGSAGIYGYAAVHAAAAAVERAAEGLKDASRTGGGGALSELRPLVEALGRVCEDAVAEAPQVGGPPRRA